MENIIELTETDFSVCEKADSFLQSAMWGEFKSQFGWTARAFLVNWGFSQMQESFPLLVLCRRLMPGFSIAYIPWGPEAPASFPFEARPKAAAQLAQMLKPFLARNTVVIRFEPPWQAESDLETKFLAAGFKKAAATVQPPDTVIINLNNSCKEILAAMKPKWRYNVCLAEKKGVQVKKSAAHELEIFYSLLKETAQRDGIAVHGFDYYKTLFEICEKQKDKQNINLYIASHEDDILAAIVVLFRGKDAVYLYGASSNVKRNLMAPYALQWKAMQDAKEAGCQNYDLFGIPPNEDPNHPMAGLYRFKTGFGGLIVHKAGSFDYVFKNIFYNLFNFAEGLRKKLRDLRKKR